MPKQPYFSRELFQFMGELKFTNERAWCNANKERYEAHVKRPMLRFIADLAPRLKRVNPAFEASPRSFFRIYRDTRFAKDKTPYKTHVAAQFRHHAGIHGRACAGLLSAPGTGRGALSAAAFGWQSPSP